MKLAFFGASVTQQKEGYANYVKTKRPDIETSIYGFGSMHIYNAGVCFIDEVLKNNPDICFLDWFSTGYKSNDMSWYLNTILYRFAQHGCHVVFLFLDRHPMEDERLAMYGNAKKYCAENGIAYLDIYNNPNVEELLRDAVHTTAKGSQVYGDRILTFLDTFDTTRPFPVHIKPTSLCNIQSVAMDTIVREQMEFSGEGKLIGIYMSVGPYSHKVDVLNGTDTKEYTIRDEWCHYERQTFHLSLINFSGKVVIRVVDSYGIYCLKPHTVYYTGNLTLGECK